MCPKASNETLEIDQGFDEVVRDKVIQSEHLSRYKVRWRKMAEGVNCVEARDRFDWGQPRLAH